MDPKYLQRYCAGPNVEVFADTAAPFVFELADGPVTVATDGHGAFVVPERLPGCPNLECSEDKRIIFRGLFARPAYAATASRLALQAWAGSPQWDDPDWRNVMPGRLSCTVLDRRLLSRLLDGFRTPEVLLAVGSREGPVYLAEGFDAPVYGGPARRAVMMPLTAKVGYPGAPRFVHLRELRQGGAA